jgi:hypothetical protein
MWTGFICLRPGLMMGSYDHGNEQLGNFLINSVSLLFREHAF